jgi:hypothetical protein
VSEKCGINSHVVKFSVLEDGETSERGGKQSGHERAWRGVYCLFWRRMPGRCGINCGKAACRVSTAYLEEDIRKMWYKLWQSCMQGVYCLFWRRMSGRCGINCGKVACRLSTACLQGGGGGGRYKRNVVSAVMWPSSWCGTVTEKDKIKHEYKSPDSTGTKAQL